MYLAYMLIFSHQMFIIDVEGFYIIAVPSFQAFMARIIRFTTFTILIDDFLIL